MAGSGRSGPPLPPPPPSSSSMAKSAPRVGLSRALWNQPAAPVPASVGAAPWRMPLLPAPFRALSPPSSAAAPRRATAGPQRALLYGRRTPLAGALLFLGIGAVSAAVTGCAFSHRFPFLGARGLSSARMESASTTVPSIVAYVTVRNREAGKKLSHSIISEKLAACVNIVPGIESVYWWEGKVQTDAEELLIIKTRETLLDALTEHVKANHEYDVPEVIALPISGGNTKYLEWIKNSTKEN